MTDEEISRHMGWIPGFMANLGRDDFAKRVRDVVAAAETAEREAACVRVQDALFPLDDPRGQHRFTTYFSEVRNAIMDTDA